jgi:hypothetical protein
MTLALERTTTGPPRSKGAAEPSSVDVAGNLVRTHSSLLRRCTHYELRQV